MKKLLLSLGLVASSAIVANAQDNAVKLNVTALAFSIGNASFEHKLSDKSSFQVGAFYASYGSDIKFTGFGITPEYRFYMTGEAMEGLFLAPFVRYQNFSIDNGTYYNYTTGTSGADKASINTFGGGVNVGYQWIFGGHFSLETFLRLGYNGGSVKSDLNRDGDDYTGLSYFKGRSILPGLNMGFAF